MLSSEPRRLTLEGEYDLARQSEVAALFASCDGDAPVVIDVTRVTYIDSTVLRELAALRSRGGERTITLVGVSPLIRRILHVVNFDKIFEIVD